MLILINGACEKCTKQIRKGCSFIRRATIAPNSIFEEEEITVIDRFSQPGSCVKKDGSTVGKMGTCIFEAPVVYVGQKNVRRRRGILLKLKDRVHCATTHSVLLYGCEAWSLHESSSSDVRYGMRRKPYGQKTNSKEKYGNIHAGTSWPIFLLEGEGCKWVRIQEMEDVPVLNSGER